MKAKLMRTFLAVSALVLVVPSAGAATNPCYRYENIYNAAVRNLDRWATETQRRTDELYRLNDRIGVRQFDLYQQYLDAQNNLQFINAISDNESARCAVNFFFSRNFGCLISAARNKANRQRSAEFRIQSALQRYNLYLVQAAGQQQRQFQRVVDGQNLTNTANAQMQNAYATLNACAAAGGVGY